MEAVEACRHSRAAVGHVEAVEACRHSRAVIGHVEAVEAMDRAPHSCTQASGIVHVVT